MPVSLVEATCALIVVDLQQGLAAAPTVHPLPEVVARTAELAAAFRARGMTVVLVTADGRPPGRTERTSRRSAALPAGFDEVMPELRPDARDLRVSKQRWGAFTGADLDAQLRSHGVTQVVVTGVATSAGVESTARSAHELGYHVVVATDAVTDTDADTHENSVRRIFPKLGETGTTTEILQLMSG